MIVDLTNKKIWPEKNNWIDNNLTTNQIEDINIEDLLGREHIVIGKEAPKVCPVCNHPQSYFEVRKESD